MNKETFLNKHACLTYGIARMDVNGNKILSMKRAGQRGFSIQTNGVLPKIYRDLAIGEKLIPHRQVELWKELIDYLRNHGTYYQRGWFTACAGE